MAGCAADRPLKRIVERSRCAAEKAHIIVYDSQCPIPGIAKKRRYIMKKAETNRFNDLYQRHLRTLKLQGKSHKPWRPTRWLCAGSWIVAALKHYESGSGGSAYFYVIDAIN
jgi:hypothetical protein